MQDINKRQSLDFVLVILSGVGVVVFGLYMALKHPPRNRTLRLLNL